MDDSLQRTRSEQVFYVGDPSCSSRWITCRVYVAWWLRWYIASVALMSALTGLHPDMDKVEFWAGRAVRVREVR